MTITIIGIGHQILDILSTNNTFHKQILHSQNIMSTKYTFGVYIVQCAWSVEPRVIETKLVAILNIVKICFLNGIDK